MLEAHASTLSHSHRLTAILMQQQDTSTYTLLRIHDMKAINLLASRSHPSYKAKLHHRSVNWGDIDT